MSVTFLKIAIIMIMIIMSFLEDYILSKNMNLSNTWSSVKIKQERT